MKRILVVDDDEAVLRQLERVLVSGGFQVVTFSSSPRALTMLRNERFDLLITDLYMPEVDGLELMACARRAQSFLPVVVMSAEHETLRMLQAATSLGAVQVLWKPFAVRPFLEVITTILGDLPIPLEKLESPATVWPGRLGLMS